MGVVVLLASQTHSLEHLRHQSLDSGATGADNLQCEGYVLPYGLVIEQFVILKNETDGTPIPWDLAITQTS